MKRLIILICFVVGLTAQAQNTLSLTGGNGHPGDTVTVTLSLTNSVAVTAMQTFIPLGDNLSYVPGSAALTSRSNGHQLTATMMEGSLRIYSYSLSLNAYNGTSGALLTFRVVLGREPGDIVLTPTQTVLSSATGTSLGVNVSTGTVTVLAPKVQVTPATIDYGHVPIRSSYTQDVTLRNIGNEPLTLGGISFSDGTLSGSVPATLAAGAQQTVTLTYSPVHAGATTMSATFHSNAKVGDSVLAIVADPFAVNELRPLDVSGYTDSVVTVELRMNNMDSIVGLQTSIKLPEALTYVAGSFAADGMRAPNYIATAGLQGDTLTLLLTSLTGTPLHGADGVVARFQLRLHGYGGHMLQLLNTVLSDEARRNVLSAVYDGWVNIYSPYISVAGSLDFGNTPVTETATADLPIDNYGDAPLVIDRVVCMQRDWQVLNSLPLTVGNYGNDTLHVSYIGTREGSLRGEMLLYTNDPRNDLMRIQLSAHRYEPNALYMVGNADASAATPEVDIVLDNYSAVTALQMDVQYPHTRFTMDPADITLSNRSNGHIVSAARQNDSTLRLLILSMQNSPFVGHNGAVARMQLHAADTLDSQPCEIRLRNVTSACTDGLNRLNSIDSTGWFATRVQHDTTYVDVHDTTYVDVYVHDTTVIHDTTLVPYAVHDTTIVHDTTYINVHDTTYIDVHDTTYIDVHDTTYVQVHDTTYIIVHDTTYIAVHDTTYINVPYAVHDTTYIDVHDTTYIDVPYAVHDTTYIDVHDTTYIDVPYAVHDTTYIDVHDTTYIDVPYVVHDTTYIDVHDTTYIDVPYAVHDTTYIDVHDTTYIDVPYAVHDTTYIDVHDTTYIDVPYAVHDTTYIDVHDTTIVIDTLWLPGDTIIITLYDTIIIYDTVYDTVYIDPTGIDGVGAHKVKLYQRDGQIVVEGADGHSVMLYDVNGRMLATKQDNDALLRFEVPASGTYMIKVGHYPAKKIVVIR